jgi:hypothetical protein
LNKIIICYYSIKTPDTGRHHSLLHATISLYHCTYDRRNSSHSVVYTEWGRKFPHNAFCSCNSLVRRKSRGIQEHHVCAEIAPVRNQFRYFAYLEYRTRQSD